MFDRLKLEIANGGMAAFATIEPGPCVDAAALEAALAAAGILHGVTDEARDWLIACLAEPECAAARRPIAEATPGVEGADAWFETAFPIGIQPGHIRDDGTMDFFDRELLKRVAPGELIGTLHPAEPGQPGCRVDGTVLPVGEVQALKLQLTANVTLADSGQITANRPGVVQYAEAQLLDVVDHYTHVGDVDFRSGHLDMVGALIVRGDVQRLFNVRATADLEVHGSVEGGTLYAGGNIAVRGGVRGDTGHVCAEGSISANYAERVSVSCGALLRLETAINCDLLAGSIQIARALLGGSASAEHSIVAHQVGSPSGTTETSLTAGVPIERPVLDARRSIDIARRVRMLARQAEIGVRGEGERGKGGKFGREVSTLARDQIAHLVARAAQRQKLARTASIEIRGAIHPGVTLQIGDARRVFDRTSFGGRFSLDPDSHQLCFQGTKR